MVAKLDSSSDNAMLPTLEVIEGGLPSHDIHTKTAALIAEIRETYRQRQDLLRAELRLNNQVKAIHRRMAGGQLATDNLRVPAPIEIGEHPSLGDIQCPDVLADLAAAPLLDAQALLAERRKPLEKQLEKLAKQLDIWPWALACRGVSGLSLAQIVGEAGDLSNYANPAKLWKRMGLAVMPDGKRQRLVSGADAIDHGYNPSRRSVMWVVGDNLIRAKHPELYAYYVAEKERLGARWQGTTPMHIHKAAHRHMEKRFLRDLWRAWTANYGMSTKGSSPDMAVTDQEAA